MKVSLLPHDWNRFSLPYIAGLTPVDLLNWDFACNYGIKVYVKREDLLHPLIGGNKFYKMWYHLQHAGTRPLLTFGGAYSNHIAAVAAIGEMLQIKTAAIIRGERPGILSPTLARAQAQGMTLHYVSRSEYRNKESISFREEHKRQFKDFYWIPEGAGDLTGARGCMDWAEAALAQLTFPVKHVYVAAGTGATLAGVSAALARHEHTQGIGVLALKGNAVMTEQFLSRTEWLKEKLMPVGERHVANANPIRLHTEYHCGGYAKKTEELLRFKENFERQTSLPLASVYTAKLFLGLQKEILRGNLATGSNVLVLHTGGLQAEAA